MCTGSFIWLLSENPDLTQKQVANIIERTAQKLDGYSFYSTPGRPNGTWNEQVGYGLLDAFAAVVAAKCRTTGFVNQIITTNTTKAGCDIWGRDVIVQNNAKLTIDAQNNVMINGPFEVQIGSALVIETSGFFCRF